MMSETIPLETAKQLLAAAEGKADEIAVPLVITVASSEGTMVARHRMDGARTGLDQFEALTR